MVRKVFWVLLVFTIFVWIGLGIYYLKSTHSVRAPVIPASEVTTFFSPQQTTPAVSENLDEVEFIVGQFQGWEEIKNSPDKYILLTDADTQKAFPKIRVGFEMSPLFGYGQEDITVFAAEKNDEDYDVLWSFEQYTSGEIDQLIKKGDLIKIVLTQEHEKEINRKDENGNYLAHWLFIKRSEGKTEVEKELGREIQPPKI